MAHTRTKSLLSTTLRLFAAGYSTGQSFSRRLRRQTIAYFDKVSDVRHGQAPRYAPISAAGWSTPLKRDYRDCWRYDGTETACGSMSFFPRPKLLFNALRWRCYTFDASTRPRPNPRLTPQVKAYIVKAVMGMRSTLDQSGGWEGTGTERSRLSGAI